MMTMMMTRLGSLVKEIRLALRSFRRRPEFTLVAVATIALGVGTSTTIFSVVNGVLLQPLTYPEPQGLITVVANWSGLQAGLGSMSFPDLVDLESVAASINWTVIRTRLPSRSTVPSTTPPTFSS